MLPRSRARLGPAGARPVLARTVSNPCNKLLAIGTDPKDFGVTEVENPADWKPGIVKEYGADGPKLVVIDLETCQILNGAGQIDNSPEGYRTPRERQLADSQLDCSPAERARHPPSRCSAHPEG